MPPCRLLSIVSMIGVPGSGKSAFCKDLKSQLSHTKETDNGSDDTSLHGMAGVENGDLGVAFIIDYDQIQTLMSLTSTSMEDKLNVGDGTLSQYKVFRSFMVRLVDCLVRHLAFGEVLDLPESASSHLTPYLTELLQSVSHSPSVILLLDDNMYYRSMRYRFYQIAKKYGIGYGQILMDTPLEECIRRNASRAGSACVDENIIVNMSSKLEIPDGCQYHWELHSINLSLVSSRDLSSVTNFLQTVLDQPVVNGEDDSTSAWREESRQITSQHVIHQADIILRQQVSLVMSSPSAALAASALSSSTDRKALAARANRSRRETLEYIRSHSAEIGTGLSQSNCPNLAGDTRLQVFVTDLFKCTFNRLSQP